MCSVLLLIRKYKLKPWWNTSAHLLEWLKWNMLGLGQASEINWDIALFSFPSRRELPSQGISLNLRDSCVWGKDDVGKLKLSFQPSSGCLFHFSAPPTALESWWSRTGTGNIPPVLTSCWCRFHIGFCSFFHENCDFYDSTYAR